MATDKLSPVRFLHRNASGELENILDLLKQTVAYINAERGHGHSFSLPYRRRSLGELSREKSQREFEAYAARVMRASLNALADGLHVHNARQYRSNRGKG